MSYDPIPNVSHAADIKSLEATSAMKKKKLSKPFASFFQTEPRDNFKQDQLQAPVLSREYADEPNAKRNAHFRNGEFAVINTFNSTSAKTVYLDKQDSINDNTNLTQVHTIQRSAKTWNWEAEHDQKKTKWVEKLLMRKTYMEEFRPNQKGTDVYSQSLTPAVVPISKQDLRQKWTTNIFQEHNAVQPANEDIQKKDFNEENTEALTGKGIKVKLNSARAQDDWIILAIII